MAKIKIEKHYDGEMNVENWEHEEDHVVLIDLVPSVESSRIEIALPALCPGEALVFVSLDSGYAGVAMPWGQHPGLLGYANNIGDRYRVQRIEAVYHFRAEHPPAVIASTGGKKVSRRTEFGIWWNGHALHVLECNKMPEAPWTVENFYQPVEQELREKIRHLDLKISNQEKNFGPGGANSVTVSNRDRLKRHLKELQEMKKEVLRKNLCGYIGQVWP
jgi:hypothetical protein